MVEHNHITQGARADCLSCVSIRPESQVHPHLVPPLPAAYVPTSFDLPEDPTEPEAVAALPLATHRIRNGRAVCDGGRDHRCHWYPSCDCDAWPCGHEYVFHSDCWIIGWLDEPANALDDSATDDTWDHHIYDEGSITTGRWPDGVIDWEWQGPGEGVTWSYASVDTQAAALPDGRRESDVPLWDEEGA
ncbi:hypothetical protein [Microbacterium allomyrinae]|uniref:Uncharacterized protein n=1 Tax=Microbacterium allomyrinae TaxID=2830666 RepID=A0A9X1S2A3_9MICO|nr:hypothetical protein [Microbacterium allomyrinae]MCC2031814.1 hypothetical protein [Microbacterium allomyrinae]